MQRNKRTVSKARRPGPSSSGTLPRQKMPGSTATTATSGHGAVALQSGGPESYQCFGMRPGGGLCNHVYDPTVGDPPEYVPVYPFEALPESWACPTCGGPKSQFRPIGPS